MEEFITAKIVDEKKSVLITGDGVNLDYFTRVKPRMSGQGSSANPICILMISRFIRDKGVGEFLDAAYILKQKFRDRLVVRLAGFEDPGNPWPADMVKIHKYASEGVIEFLGYRDDVRPLLEEADIYVLPSYREGLSVSILEAMAMELPIITTDVPGCRDLVVNGLNGLVIPVKDAQALAVASEKLILDSQLRYKYGLVSRNLVESRYSSKKIKNLMLSLYSKQLELKGICISGIADSFKNRSC